ncbi:MAG: ribonuclease HI family protein [Caldilineaceae bacterium]|nr:ribonuclease HI family protein [Caldilineaceae bacterium]
MNTKTIIHCDAACDPNPGGAMSWAWVITEGPLSKFMFGWIAAKDGNTSNVAEYIAIGKAARWCAEQQLQRVVIRSDSQIVVRQINNVVGCHQPHLRKLLGALRPILTDTGAQIEWVPRERNRAADALSYEALQQSRTVDTA